MLRMEHCRSGLQTHRGNATVDTPCRSDSEFAILLPNNSIPVVAPRCSKAYQDFAGASRHLDQSAKVCPRRAEKFEFEFADLLKIPANTACIWLKKEEWMYFCVKSFSASLCLWILSVD